MRIHPYRRIPAQEALAAEIAALGDGEEALLVWEAAEPCAILPRRGSAEAHLVSDERAVAVLQRESGGGAVLLGPGCLNYALVLSLEARPWLVDVERSYEAILGSVLKTLRVPGARAIGSDLVLSDRKFGGHAQRRTRHALLHHGTILYSFDFAAVGQVLREPTRQPAYRRGRTHEEFLTNIPRNLDDLLKAFERLT